MAAPSKRKTQEEKLARELKEARAQQAATAAILKVTARSRGDARPVFEAIATAAIRLIDGHSAVVAHVIGDSLHLGALTSTSGRGDAVVRSQYPRPLSQENAHTRAIRLRRTIEVADTDKARGPLAQYKRIGRARGYRSQTVVPLMRGREAIGTISVARKVPGRLSPGQITLLKTFADQAVIAIENARSFNETKEALDRQTATAEILKVIASSPSDVQPVFEAIVNSAKRLIGGNTCSVTRLVEGHLHLAAFTSTDRANDKAYRALYPQPIEKREAVLKAVRTGKPQFVTDVIGKMRASPRRKALGARKVGSLLLAPLMREGVAIGMIHVARAETGAFSAAQIELLQTFADQAVIAIENVRLFNETKESLARQTATADILRVIGSSMTDAKPVFAAIVKSCAELFGEGGISLRLVKDGNLEVQASHGYESDVVLPISRDSAIGACVLEAQTIHLPDLEKGAEHYPRIRQLGLRRGFHSGIYTPLLREGRAVGSIAILRRASGAFSDKEVALLKTFADQAVIAIENVRLFNETREALERQTATSEVLRVISSSPTDVQPVFDSIAESAATLCGAKIGFVAKYDGGLIHMMASWGTAPEAVASVSAAYPMKPEGESTAARVIRARALVQIADVLADSSYMHKEAAEAAGFRSALGVPLIRDEQIVGAIVVVREQAGVFQDKQVDLLKTFADQAVIAIENVRLFNETKEALERQTATAEILKVIASSPSDVQPVFDAIVRTSLRLTGGYTASVARLVGDALHLAASSTTSSSGDAVIQKYYPIELSSSPYLADVLNSRKPRIIADTESDPDVRPELRELARTRGFRAMLPVPLVCKGSSIGIITVTSVEPRGFTEHALSLLQTFADQAVIAIENVRLFNETKESLERQTATAEILKVIASSPSDVQPVFDAIAQSAKRLLAGGAALVARRAGDQLELAAYTSAGEAADAELLKLWPSPITGKGHMGKAILSGAPVGTSDLQNDDNYSESFRAMARTRGVRGVVSVPMLREGEAIGVISVNRSVPGKFSDHQTNLLKTFADQAVIAIENVRLFNETKESLERQTATGDILASMSGSMTDTKPVFDAILRNLLRLFGTRFAVVQLLRDGIVEIPAVDGDPGFERFVANYPRPIDATTVGGRAMLTKQTVHFAPLTGNPDAPEATQQFARDYGFNSVIAAPMIREGNVVGAIVTAHRDEKPFEEKQVALIKAFADQAVIAIENVRLFNETKESLERQTATAEILQVISASPTDVQPVFDTIAKASMRLIGGFSAGVFRFIDGQLHLAALTSTNPSGDEALRSGFPQVPRGQGEQALRTGLPVVCTDIENDPEVNAEAKVMARARGWQSRVLVPMMREGVAIGNISVTRREAGGFSEHNVGLLKTFADQAVIAIENVRLFNETKEALERQTATAEILKVIASSPSDVQPVFEAILQSASRLFGRRRASLRLVEGGVLRHRAILDPDKTAFARAESQPIDRTSLVGIAALDGRPIQVSDTYGPDATPYMREHAQELPFRALACAPLLREGAVIGVLGVSSTVPGSLTDKQMALLSTFADQAVIAIENVRLFKELEAREAALTKSVGQLTALSEVGHAISSTLDLDKVLQTIVSHAVKITGLEAGGIYEYDEATEQFSLRAAERMGADVVATLRSQPIRKGEGTVGRTAETREAVQVPDVQLGEYDSRLREILVRSGRRAVIAVPLLHEDRIIGALSVQKVEPGAFAPEIVDLLKTFATQSAMAIQNARLYREIADKGKQLEEASRHKSNFLASMSHELRTPLNAILGFNEMILGQVYGEVPTDMQEPLADIQTSGKHLLRLINNVLDLAKIEAGRMELSLQDYSVQDTVDSVHSTLRPLAAEKGLEFLANVPNDLPLAYGDGGRIAQCLMNLAGNSLKFTKAGKVEISVQANNGLLVYKVEDTGIGIPPDKIGSLFTEFKQTDATIASEYGGTGLGLSISRKFVEMHGGRIWVESELGKGSAFIFEIPLRVQG